MREERLSAELVELRHRGACGFRGAEVTKCHGGIIPRQRPKRSISVAGEEIVVEAVGATPRGRQRHRD
jgi:hypothetical protein